MRASLRDWAKQALDHNSDKPDLAAAWLAGQADEGLRDELRSLGARQIVRNFFSEQRTSAMSMATGRVMATMGDPEVAGRVSARMARLVFWDAYTLFGMTPIREATKDQLEDSAGARESQAKGELRLAAFERTVARRLAPGQRVCDAFTSEAIEAMARSS
jgi:hypothetical protein